MKKGFTLIELLAVILILGIIALIAIPTVNNVIEQAREESIKRSAEQYISAVEQAVAMQEMKGNIIDGTRSVDDLKEYVELKGTLPDSGTVTIENNEVTACNLQIGEYTITSSENHLTIVKGEESDTSSKEESDTSEDKETNTSPIEELTKEMFIDEETTWDDIIANVKAGRYDNTSTSELIGAERKLVVAAHTNDCARSSGSGNTYKCTSSSVGEQTLKVRIANVTDCPTSLKSKTACGFVIEFVDIIEKHNMDTADSVWSFGDNIGSWPSTEMRTYLNNIVLNALPNEIKSNIIETSVVTGYGSEDTTNFTSIDKLYLLSSKEIYSNGDSYDTGKGATRQLDYYAKMGGDSNISIKKYNGNAIEWWLRNPWSPSASFFDMVYSDGSLRNHHAYNTFGVAPAFRLK